MMPEKIWRRVRSTEDRESGKRVVLLSGVWDGVRLWCEKHWSAPAPDGDRTLQGERYYTTDPERAHSSAEAALAAALESVENNQP